MLVNIVLINLFSFFILQEFHDDLSARNKDVERLTKLPTVSKDTRRSLHGRQAVTPNALTHHYKLTENFLLNLKILIFLYLQKIINLTYEVPQCLLWLWVFAL